jgi:predicted small lipoprotein YifL
MNRPAFALASLVVLVALGGCGQKGALYLPDRKKSTVPAGPPAQSPVAPATPAPASPGAAPPA